MKSPELKESLWVQILKTLLLVLSALGYTWPHVGEVGHLVVVFAVIVASILAFTAARARVRAIWCVAIAFVMTCIGALGSSLTLQTFGVYDVASTIQVSRFWYFSALIFGIVFMTRSLALRWRTTQILEAVLVIGTFVYLFFEHRDLNLTSPRNFADLIYSRGFNPMDVYRWIGIGAAFLAIPMVFGRAKFGRVVYAMGCMALLALLLTSLIGTARLNPSAVDPLGLRGDQKQDSGQNDEPDSDDENDENDENDGSSGGNSDEDNSGQAGDNNSSNGNGKSNNNNGNSNSNSDKPQPVAVAVFYDEYQPASGVFYFRQNVLSEYDGNHLVASTMDDDVISSMPATGNAQAVAIQNEDLHSKISTSMFLMVEHSQPPQLAMGQRIFTIQNPDPSLFVTSYGVESLGLTVDVQRFIGRRSIPKDWSEQKRDHYLKIPDDPRYRALSDTIVRQIDPRFAEDDVVKALYIKTWLEKNGFYTRKTRHIDDKDPTASFLFGSLRGYCVHFAHSAALLFRSQGIAARVAIGYAFDNRMRGTNSAVLIMGNQAHAWPEIFIDGVGWVTLDIYPENSDEPPSAFVDQDLESLFGELARNDKSGGKAEQPRSESIGIPWQTLAIFTLALLGFALLLCYSRKIVIIVLGRHCSTPNQIHRAARAAIFVWSMYGHSWRAHLTLEAFARNHDATARLVRLATASRLGATLSDEDARTARALLNDAMREASAETPVWRRILGWVNPFVRI